MQNKEYLNEEWYQKVKKKITRISLVIFIIAVLVGGGLIATGIIKTDLSKKEAKEVNEERYNAAYKESEEKVAAANKRLDEITKEKATLNSQYDSKSQECDSYNVRDTDWFTKVNQCRREASAIKSKINNLESEEFELKNDDYTVYYNEEIAKNYMFLCFIGGGVIVIGSFIALGVYIIAKRREITAFQTQQIMPVAQEDIEKMAPTVGNAAGKIAEAITTGINDELNNKE